MNAKPSFLGPSTDQRSRTRRSSRRTTLRPPYPDEAFDLLAGLLAERPGAVLDLGCGTGIVARRLVGLGEHVERVDALDVSPAMLAEATAAAQRRSSAPALDPRAGRGRAAPATVRAGDGGGEPALDGLAVVLPRLHDVLAPDGLLVIIVDDDPPPPWQAELLPILQRYSTNQEYQRGLRPGRGAPGAWAVPPPGATADRAGRLPAVDRRVRRVVSRAERLLARADGAEAAVEFDDAVRSLVSRYGDVGRRARGDRRRRLGPAPAEATRR